MSDDQDAPEEATELLPLREAILAVANDTGRRIREYGSRDTFPQSGPDDMARMVRDRDKLVKLAGQSEEDLTLMIESMPKIERNLTETVRQLAHHVQETHGETDPS